MSENVSPDPWLAEPSGDLDAPIVAVTVFTDSARVTRRARVRLRPGEQVVSFGGLPLTLRTDSIRIAGTGPATVLGVDIDRRRQPRATDEALQELEERLRAARGRLAEIWDEDAGCVGQLDFLTELARRSTRSYAAALAAGQTDPAQVAAVAEALAAQQSVLRRERRMIVERRTQTEEEVAAHERGLAARQQQREPDRLAAAVTLAVTAEDDVELDLSYVVDQAGWRSAYDLRLDGDTLVVSWFALVSQSTGEDWPECELRLSTARPSLAATVPELDPWFLDRVRPMPPPQPMLARSMMAGPPGAGAAGYVTAEYAQPIVEAAATVEHGATAATYQPARAVAVPADGGAHRATVAVLTLSTERDYVTAPVRALEAHLRAKVSNTSGHTLPAGSAAIFHGSDFVGSTNLEVWAPGQEVELALGVDDRIRVERELVRRAATKAVLGATRRRDTEHRIIVTNHTPQRARVSVLDQLPISRDEGIVVREQRLDPVPAERTELGVLTWRWELNPNESAQIHLGIRVEEAKGVDLAGWRE